MAKNRNKNRIFRLNRRIRGQTNYKQRLNLLKSNMTRAVIRKSNNGMLVQFANYCEIGDKLITSARASDLVKLGFTLNKGNISSAYLTGMLAGKKLISSGFKGEVIVDFGLQNANLKGSRIYAAVNGIVDSGVNLKVSEDIFPPVGRVNGEHLSVKDAKSIIDKVKKSIEGMK